MASGLADTNPVEPVRLFKENNQRVRFLGDDEQQALAAEQRDIDDCSKVRVVLHTGLRRGEQFGLR